MLIRSESVFEAVVDPKPEALVLFCSDPRFQAAFDDFLCSDLGLDSRNGECVRIVAAGGSGIAAHPALLPKDFRFLGRRIELHCGASKSIRRLILIGHEDCHWYHDLVKSSWFVQLGTSEDGAPHDDLARIAKANFVETSPIGTLTRKFNLSLELYFAYFSSEDQASIKFAEIPAT